MTDLTEISKDYGYCVAKDINKIIAKIDEAIAIVNGMIDGCENILEGLKNVKQFCCLLDFNCWFAVCRNFGVRI